MCRWFAYLSPDEECLLEDVLINPVSNPPSSERESFLSNLG